MFTLNWRVEFLTKIDLVFIKVGLNLIKDSENRGLYPCTDYTEAVALFPLLFQHLNTGRAENYVYSFREFVH